MIDLETAKAALRRIVTLEPKDVGKAYLDEWIEADLFAMAQNIAREALRESGEAEEGGAS